MKSIINRLIIFFILCSVFFITCSDINKDPEMGIFTISFDDETARMAPYPPHIPPGSINTDPDAPTLADLKFTVTFTRVGGSSLPPFEFEGNGLHQGSVPVGTYNITVDVHILPDDYLYARGAAVLNPVQITTGNNDLITIRLFYWGILMSMNGGPDINFNSLQDALDSIHITGLGNYEIKIGSNQELPPYTLNFPAGTSVTLRALTAPITVQLLADGNLFTVSSDNTLVLDSGITLRGRNDNTTSLVLVNGGGTLFMRSGSIITMNERVAAGFFGSGSGVIVDSTGVFTMDGGEITGNNGFVGGGVYVFGTFTMNGGTIFQNTASSAGGVRVEGVGASFVLDGGTISGNIASNGSGVDVMNGADFTMFSGTISGNIGLSDGSHGGAGVFVIDSNFVMNGGTISGNSTPNNSGGGVHISSGSFTMNNGNISGNDAFSGGGVIVGTNSVIGTPGTFTMIGGSINGNTTVGRGGGVHLIDNDSVFIMQGGIITGNTANQGGGIYVSQGNFNIESAAVISMNEASSGGGVFVNQGTLQMTGGSINENDVAFHGGGVYIQDGIFIMTGGNITENTAGHVGNAGEGGGVFIGAQLFHMQGGIISGNIVNYDGGGVLVLQSATFLKDDSGGIITGYTTDPINGNVVIDVSTGVIQNNRGHAVFAVNVTPYRRETTVIAGETFGWDGNTSSPIGFWEF
ncbi:MAG: hypothetical protein FWG77_08605 [Treponema sp.]|nr:hypothetical protein [Treponema sp.]